MTPSSGRASAGGYTTFTGAVLREVIPGLFWVSVEITGAPLLSGPFAAVPNRLTVEARVPAPTASPSTGCATASSPFTPSGRGSKERVDRTAGPAGRAPAVARHAP